ncbi:hypothetical protein BH09BAC6_BH09BAC6_06810 [soil metagenome]
MKYISMILILAIASVNGVMAQQKMKMGATMQHMETGKSKPKNKKMTKPLKRAKHHPRKNIKMRNISKSSKTKAPVKGRQMGAMKMNMATPTKSKKTTAMPMKDGQMDAMNGMKMGDTAKSKAGGMTMPVKSGSNAMNAMKMSDTTRAAKMAMPLKIMPMKGGSMIGMDMGGKKMDAMQMMSSAQSKNLPMGRDGSGTSWLPDASPMYGIMLNSGKWSYMLHGSIALRYTKQDLLNKGSRGGDQLDAPNWFMGMAQRNVGKNGLLHFNVMMSLDRLTEGGDGYPLLFQTGESWNGVPLVDRQHPHDLFSELSASYTYSFSKKTDLSIYVGYPGEPALGPVAFMHRPSAMSNPDAPISHHWSDATHVTFGVATIGFRVGELKIEASSFSGSEPDENRYNFDRPKINSWSARLNYNPSANWALQVSHSFIKGPEFLRPNENVYRSTASATYSTSLGDEKLCNATSG